MKGTDIAMDNFMDKLAHKFASQEIIKANLKAETKEMQKLQIKISEYDKILQDTRNLITKNTELSEKIEGKIDKMIDDSEEERQERERAYEVRNEIDFSAITDLLEDKFKSSDDFVHKENVKVYRNVQAVVVEEFKKYEQTTQESQKKLNRKLNAAIAVGSISMVASVCTVVMWVVFFLLAAGIIK